MENNEPLPPDLRLDLICTPSDSGIGAKPQIETIAPAEDSCVENRVTTLDLQVGLGLFSLVDSNQSGEILKRIASVRQQVRQDLGFTIPMIIVGYNNILHDMEYQILLKEQLVGRGELQNQRLFALDPGDITHPIPGHAGVEPVHGMAGVWINIGDGHAAILRGYTVVNHATIIVTHLATIIDDHAAELIDHTAVCDRLISIAPRHQRLFEDAFASGRLTTSIVTIVLQNLLREHVSVEDLPKILESLAAHAPNAKSIETFTMHVRTALGRSIVSRYLHNHALHVIELDVATETYLVERLRVDADGQGRLTLDDDFVKSLCDRLIGTEGAFTAMGAKPVLLCAATDIRWHLRNLLCRQLKGWVVLALDEVPVDVPIITLPKRQLVQRERFEGGAGLQTEERS